MSTTYDGRAKTEWASSVNDALQTVNTHGRRHAAQLMSASNVPFSVIVRVLAEPNKRRRFNESATDGTIRPRTGSLHRGFPLSRTASK